MATERYLFWVEKQQSFFHENANVAKPVLIVHMLSASWCIGARACVSFHIGNFFSNQSTSSTIFAQISPKLAWKYLNKKTSSLQFWVPFLLNQSTYSDFAKVFTHFAQISTDFARILRDFARIFTESKVVGVRFHPLNPRLLHQCLDVCVLKNKKMQNFLHCVK